MARPNGAVSTRNRPCFWTVYALLASASAALVFGFRNLPMADLPQFAAQLSIWVHLDDPAYGFAELFEIHWFTPYLVAFLLARPFVGLLGVIGAVKLVVWLGLIATPLALRALLRAVGRDPWPPGRRSCG